MTPMTLPTGRHIVCFWKQNDLGLLGRRPDRWIAQWAQDPTVKKVLVFEAPVANTLLQQWLHLSTTLDRTSASEFKLMLNQWLSKHLGQCDTAKVFYKSYLAPEGENGAGAGYLRWVLQQVQQAQLEAPTLVLWPACFVNPALIQAIGPASVVLDLVDDQRLFPGNESQVASITAQYRSFMGLADRLMSNSPGLIASFEAEFGCPIEHVPNSALPMMPNQQAASPALLAQALALKRRPVVGYVGNMRGRMDIPALLAVMARHPEWDFWYVGQTQSSAFYQAARQLSNCRFWGTLTQADAHAVMAHFDVALIPFKQDALVNSMSPIKADSYRSANLPVVSLLAMTPEHFDQALVAALASRP
jgi:hypothetical protein